ncbi:ABC transporter ATP-binding protein [Chitinophaga sp. GCM10012297]|uniref:ABC transporter ATP-binding protein n=1 Tax=Chitinophaga chungangae TaxID=2821488 RepID=A0ABS3YIX4_9BACT|nr:ABC transporter ATP-binding protein [Chitinophaga chungangae]MBO9154640.1 ABC transporter ATP-binding protein [Chitinophaga chungangae]
MEHKQILSLHKVSKRYGPIQALKSVSFNVPEGSVFGVLGPNGSGKTTLLGIIMDVLKPNAGTYKWFGLEPHADLRKRIGTLLETPNFYHYYSAVRNLQINAAIKGRGHDDIERVLKITELWERKDSKFSTFSLGMKQRLAIANALLGRPEVLLLDEPTNGLDPAGIAEIRELIRNLGQEGTTVIMASHLLDEVEKVCTHVAILKKGDLVAAGHVDEVLANEDMLEVSAANLELLETVLNAMPGLKSLRRHNGGIQVIFENGQTAEQLNRSCFEKGITLNYLAVKRKSLEARFIELTN